MCQNMMRLHVSVKKYTRIFLLNTIKYRKYLTFTFFLFINLF